MSDTAVGVAVGVKDGLVLVVDDCVNKSGTEDCVVWTAMLVDVGVLVVGVTSVVNKGVVSVARAGVVGSGVVGPGVVGSGVVRGVVRKTSVLAAGSVVANGSGALVMSCRLSSWPLRKSLQTKDKQHSHRIAISATHRLPPEQSKTKSKSEPKNA